MKQQSYALICQGVVQQLLTSDADLTTMFAPGLHWIAITGTEVVSPGYLYDGSAFKAPTLATIPARSLSLAEIEAELVKLRGAVAALMAATERKRPDCD